MILSDRDIQAWFKKGWLQIEPEPNWEQSLGSCSLDLRLAEVQISSSPAQNAKVRLKSGEILISPGGFCLGITLEYVVLPENLCAFLHGRSSLGRKGLMIHSTAPLVDAGFRGRIVLELFNAGAQPVKLRPGGRICALSFEQLSSPVLVPYYKKKGAKYLNQAIDG